MPAFRTGLVGAEERLEVIVHWESVARRFQRIARRCPDRAKRAMGAAVAWWHSEAVRRIPVRATRPRRRTKRTTVSSKAPLYAKRGRGMLRKKTQSFVRASAEEIRGGITSGTDYAIWLAAGTRFIAGGDVMRWSPGQATIKDWPAKQLNKAKGYAAELPILLPWQCEARDRLVEGLRKDIAQ